MKTVLTTLLVSAALLSTTAGQSVAAADQPARSIAAAAVQPPKTDKPADPPKDQPKKEDKPAPASQEKNNVATTEYLKMSTSKGDIYLKLERAKAPISTENFLNYVDKKFYDGTIFHRVVADFVIQGGGFTADLKKKDTDKPIKNEWSNGLKNKRGTLAMARTSAPDSATSQFYINLKDNAALDLPRDGAAYAVFGEVTRGMDVVDNIAKVKVTDKGSFQNLPVEAVTINSVTRTTKEEAEKK